MTTDSKKIIEKINYITSFLNNSNDLSKESELIKILLDVVLMQYRQLTEINNGLLQTIQKITTRISNLEKLMIENETSDENVRKDWVVSLFDFSSMSQIFNDNRSQFQYENMEQLPKIIFYSEDHPRFPNHFEIFYYDVEHGEETSKLFSESSGVKVFNEYFKAFQNINKNNIVGERNKVYYLGEIFETNEQTE